MLQFPPRPGSGRVVLETHDSSVLRGNPPGDPSRRILPVYLPPSYDKNSTTSYPVVYCLTGFTGSARSWFNFQAWAPSIDERLDALFSGGVSEMIVVFPDCFTRYGGSQYLDSAAVGNYRSYITDEIIPFIDGRYRTKADRRFRGVMGKSSGGYGALMAAMERPDLFSAVACHSGDMYFEYCYLPEFPVAARGLERVGGLRAFLEKLGTAPLSGREEHAAVNIVAMSACYSPNPGSLPHLFDLPFEEFTGRMIPDIWRRWKEMDPLERLRGDAQVLREAGFVFLDCGRRDEYFLNLGARMFVAELASRGITHEYEEFDGGHSGTQHRYDVSFRKLSEYFQT